VREYVEANFEQLVDQELAQYPLLSQFLPDALIKELLHPLKSKLPELYQLLEPHVLQGCRRQLMVLLIRALACYASARSRTPS